MLRPRIIPCLLVQNGGLVKTVQFGTSRYVGDPINAIKVFNEKRVDEIMVIDIDATVQGREPNYKLIEDFSAEARMPVSYVGGVRTVDQIRRIISLGVEKVGMSAAAIENPALISEAASEVGRQSVVVVLDVKQVAPQEHKVFTNNGTISVTESPLALAQKAMEYGAGELVIYSIDRDGTNSGYDIDLIASICDAVSIPVTAVGGAGGLEDLKNLIGKFGVIGAGAGDIFVFKGKYKAVLIRYPTLSEKRAICAYEL